MAWQPTQQSDLQQRQQHQQQNHHQTANITHNNNNNNFNHTQQSQQQSISNFRMKRHPELQPYVPSDRDKISSITIAAAGSRNQMKSIGCNSRLNSCNNNNNNIRATAALASTTNGGSNINYKNKPNPRQLNKSKRTVGSSRSSSTNNVEPIQPVVRGQPAAVPVPKPSAPTTPIQSPTPAPIRTPLPAVVAPVLEARVEPESVESAVDVVLNKDTAAAAATAADDSQQTETPVSTPLTTPLKETPNVKEPAITPTFDVTPMSLSTSTLFSTPTPTPESKPISMTITDAKFSISKTSDDDERRFYVERKLREDALREEQERQSRQSIVDDILSKISLSSQ